MPMGYIYIVDRKKDMILSGGFNIYSKEVEQTILEVEGVADVAVVGAPDEIYGEAVAAFVELDQEASADRGRHRSRTGSRLQATRSRNMWSSSTRCRVTLSERY